VLKGVSTHTREMGIVGPKEREEEGQFPGSAMKLGSSPLPTRCRCYLNCFALEPMQRHVLKGVRKVGDVGGMGQCMCGCGKWGKRVK